MAPPIVNSVTVGSTRWHRPHSLLIWFLKPNLGDRRKNCRCQKPNDQGLNSRSGRGIDREAEDTPVLRPHKELASGDISISTSPLGPRVLHNRPRRDKQAGEPDSFLKRTAPVAPQIQTEANHPFLFQLIDETGGVCRRPASFLIALAVKGRQIHDADPQGRTVVLRQVVDGGLGVFAGKFDLVAPNDTVSRVIAVAVWLTQRRVADAKATAIYTDFRTSFCR